MDQVPQGKNMRPTYENFFVECPWCGYENIFNRASDIKTFDPIDYMEVQCLSAQCGKPFYLNGDLVNSAYEMIIFDCYELLERKHYAYCILNLAQAFEVFFSQYFRVQLLYKPFAAEPEGEFDRFMASERRLRDSTGRLTFSDMRNLFLINLLYERQPKSMKDAERIIGQLPLRPRCPSDEEILNTTNDIGDPVRQLLWRLKRAKAPELRNDVVHKRAYRPTLEEVTQVLKETREILIPLASRLEVQVPDFNWYQRQVLG